MKKVNIMGNLIISRIMTLLIISFFVLIIINHNSDYLINDLLRNFLLLFIIILTIFLKVFNNRIKNNVKITRKSIIYRILLSIYIIGCITFISLLYSPYNGFRDWFVTTAMQTKSHQYYAKWFYSDKQIEEVMSNNYIIEPEGNTDKNLIDIHKEVTYKNDYEKAILEKDYDNQEYKIIEFEVNGASAYIAAIYDPCMVHVGVTKYLNTRGQYVTDMAKDKDSMLAINGGGFYDPNHNSAGGTPRGVTFSNGSIVTGQNELTDDVIGFTDDNVLMLLHDVTASEAQSYGIRDAVSMGPFLIINGKSAFISGNGGWGRAARTAIGQREDGIVLFLVVDSNELRTGGADMSDLTQIMENYGAVNAANLDGGTSSVIVENYEIINDPIDSDLKHQTRPIATMFYLK